MFKCTHDFVGILDVGRDDDVAVVDGEPPAPDGDPANVRDLEFARKRQEDVFVPHLLQARRVVLLKYTHPTF